MAITIVGEAVMVETIDTVFAKPVHYADTPWCIRLRLQEAAKPFCRPEIGKI
ncbi:MAG: hypothetical protein GX460_05595 [Firmicutes bacterium]|jgi:hypothetical protein|nr:hypothetical protein [Bacillota bacterium]